MATPNAGNDQVSKDRDIYDRIMNYMNTERVDSLLLFSWNIFSYSDADEAKIIAMDKNGFSLQIKNNVMVKAFQYTNTRVYKFDPPLIAPTESKERLMRLHEKHSTMIWPGTCSIIAAN